MKRLVLVRHGKSSWKYNLPDEERPLKKRAFKDAKLVMEAFQNFSSEGNLLWTSPAERAKGTAELFKSHFQVPADFFEIKKELYTFEVDSLLKTIQTCPNNIDQLFVFGHNPAITEVANKLGDQEFSKMPTTGLVVIDFEVEKWNEIKNGKTILYLFPKNLK